VCVCIANTGTSNDILLLLLHPFNGLFFTTTWVCCTRKVKPSLDLDETRWYGFGMQWHQLGHMQTVCTSLQTDNHTNTSSLHFYRLYALPDAQPTMSKHSGTSSDIIIIYLRVTFFHLIETGEIVTLCAFCWMFV